MNIANEKNTTSVQEVISKLPPELLQKIFKYTLPQDRHFYRFKNYETAITFSHTNKRLQTIAEDHQLWKEFLPRIIASLGVVFEDEAAFLADLDKRLENAKMGYFTYVKIITKCNVRAALLEKNINLEQKIIDLSFFEQKVGGDSLLNFLIAQLMLEAKREYRLIKAHLNKCGNIKNSAFLDVYALQLFYPSVSLDLCVLKNVSALSKIIEIYTQILNYEVRSKVVFERSFWLATFSKNFVAASHLLALTKEHLLFDQLNETILSELSYSNKPEAILKYFSGTEIVELSKIELSTLDKPIYECYTYLGYVAQLNTQQFEEFKQILGNLKIIVEDVSYSLRKLFKYCWHLHSGGRGKSFLKNLKHLEASSLIPKMLNDDKSPIFLVKVLDALALSKDAENFLKDVKKFFHSQIQNPLLILFIPQLYLDKELSHPHMLACFPELNNVTTQDEANEIMEVLEKIKNVTWKNLIIENMENKKITSAELLNCQRLGSLRTGQTLLDDLFDTQEKFTTILGCITLKRNLVSVLMEGNQITQTPQRNLGNFLNVFGLTKKRKTSPNAEKLPEAKRPAVNWTQLNASVAALEKIAEQRKEYLAKLQELDKAEMALRKNLTSEFNTYSFYDKQEDTNTNLNGVNKN